MSGERVERRLAAILAVDVAGYSRLMGQDEEGTLASLRAIRRDLGDPKVTEHRGRIVKTTGDGLLVEFASVVDAVRCAVDIQRAMQARNATIEPGRRIEFRMGINVGDIIIEDGDIFGDGVNIAARLEALAEPGGVTISAAAHEQVRDKLEIAFEDTGEQKVKNIARPVRAFRLRQSGAAAPVASSAPSSTAPRERPAIAVLPFQNMSGDAEQEYFADGIVEDVITGLSRIRWLSVIARNSSFTYKGQPIEVKRVARELGVRYLLEGSVRKAGNRVRITTQLIDAESGAHLWAERYDRPLDDIFAVQDEITLATIGAIEPSLRAAEIERVKRKRPDSLDAYDLLLRALPHLENAVASEVLTAVPLLEAALALEPEYALAHAHLAWCHEVLFLRGARTPQNKASALRHARAALAHGRDDATALALAGFAISMVEHDQATAIEAFEAALALSPSCSAALTLGSVAMGWANDPERAIAWGERALHVCPLGRQIFAAHLGLTLGHFVRGRHAEAVTAAQRAVRLNPGLSATHVLLAASLAAAGRIAEAQAAAAEVLRLDPRYTSALNETLVAAPPALAQPFVAACQAAGLP
jgi:adenylate cyclase